MKKIISLVIAVIPCLLISTSIIGEALNDHNAIITNVPSTVTKVDVQVSDSDHNPISSDIKAKINNGEVELNELSETGYYYVTFYTDTAEIGSTEFFLSDSGNTYSIVYNSNNEEILEKNKSIKFQEYSTYRILDITGNNMVKFTGVDETAVKANVNVSYQNGSYGSMQTEIICNNSETTISNIGGEGEYSVDFLDKNDEVICMASFNINEKNNLYITDFVYDEVLEEWVETLVPVDVICVDSYDDYLASIGGTENSGCQAMSVTISGVGTDVVRSEVQATDLELNEIVVNPTITIDSGQIELSNLYAGCYLVNYYNSINNIVGYSEFYINENSEIYSYEFNNNEPVLTPISSIVYNSLIEEKNEYQFGDISVSIYGVPEDIDSIESYYLYGNTTDESIMFEPEYSSTSVEPFIISGLGQEGNYKISFFKNGDVVGNATFNIGKDAKIYELDYTYDPVSDTWQSTLVDADEICYYENTDIQDSDNYSYGNIKLNVTNVPSSAYSVEAYYYNEDDTFTYGTQIFPTVALNNGIAVISNLGEKGYYQFNFIAADGVSKVGYVCIYVDEKSETYLYETSVNTDVMQLESTLTKCSSVVLNQYNSNTVNYTNGSYKVAISNVPNTANNILVTVVTEDGNYSTFESEISVPKDGVFVLDNLGMNGDYVVSFMTGKDYIGSASFYLKNGKTYKASYSGNYELSLSPLNNVVFVSNSDVTTFEVGDVDLNGQITIADIVLLQKYLLGAVNYNASEFNISDINGDGNVNVFDLALLKQNLLNNK